MKKRSIQKNQMIIAVLVILIAAAGYLNFRSGMLDTEDVFVQDDLLLELNDQELEEITVAQEEPMTEWESQETQSTEHIGEAVLTSTVSAYNFSAQAKLNREQMRSKNKEALIEVINNQNVTDQLKQSAMEDLMDMTNRSEMEVAVENLLTAKGFENSVVSLTEESCDVVVCKEELTSSECAQIEDIVRRKTNVGIENIVITTLN